MGEDWEQRAQTPCPPWGGTRRWGRVCRRTCSDLCPGLGTGLRGETALIQRPLFTPKAISYLMFKNPLRISLVVQWSGFFLFTAKGPGSTPGQGMRNLQASWPKPKPTKPPPISCYGFLLGAAGEVGRSIYLSDD